MHNEDLIRNLIKGSVQRAVQESVAAVFVLAAFAAILSHSEVRSWSYYGCLIILVATGFIVGVVWSHALSQRLLQNHAPSDIGFWREVFHVQARLLRRAPLWYCAPLCAGAVLIVAPAAGTDHIPFLAVAAFFAVIFGLITWLNRRGAHCIEQAARQLTDHVAG